MLRSYSFSQKYHAQNPSLLFLWKKPLQLIQHQIHDQQHDLHHSLLEIARYGSG